jgi:hypothetical protein
MWLPDVFFSDAGNASLASGSLFMISSIHPYRKKRFCKYSICHLETLHVLLVPTLCVHSYRYAIVGECEWLDTFNKQNNTFADSECHSDRGNYVLGLCDWDWYDERNHNDYTNRQCKYFSNRLRYLLFCLPNWPWCLFLTYTYLVLQSHSHYVILYSHNVPFCLFKYTLYRTICFIYNTVSQGSKEAIKRLNFKDGCLLGCCAV